MLLLIYRKARYVEHVSTADRADEVRANMLQSGVDCGQFSSDHRAYYWTSTDFLIPFNAYGL